MQVRIVHRTIGTNVILKEMSIMDNRNCSFCEDEKDSIDHMFWKYKHIKEFWKSLEGFIGVKNEKASNLTLTEKIVLFGIYDYFKSDATIDFIILLTKQYICRCRFNKCKPILSIFIKMQKGRYDIEKIHCDHTAKPN